MAGQPLLQALSFVAAVVIVVVLTRSRRVHPFFLLVAVATAFGLIAGLSVSLVGKAFGNGFAQALYGPGLIIVAAAFVSAIVESAGAEEWFAAKAERWHWLGASGLTAAVGLIAGLSASPASAFVLLTPLRRAVAPTNATPLALALALSAGHGLLLISPVMVAAASILGADWGRVALIGVPVALVLAVFAAAWPRLWVPASESELQPATTPPTSVAPVKRGLWPVCVLLLATAIPVLLLMFQSVGSIPTEPLGGGATRELILGLGRPLILFLLLLGITVIGLWRTSFKLFADADWSVRVLGEAATLLLIVGAAGGWQRLCQETGMAELLGEHLLSWPAGVLVPFLVAAVVKTLQGSSLVAALTTAGMVQPLMISLGLDTASGKALAALAIGAGAMTVSHLNDELFWLATSSARLSPAGGLTRFSVGTLLQGLIAAALLLVLSVLI